MLWYLLSPIRGTTQPPRLSPDHVVRRAFYRHGKTTATHWLVVMLVIVAIAMGFSYPTIFLSENPTAGFAAYPHHVWTSAKPITNSSVEVDVEMRQIWVHGSYMSALDKSVLKQALAIQQSLVGDEQMDHRFPGLNDKLRSSPSLDWGYHSPLMYWNNSAAIIDADDDLQRTVNVQKHSSSSLNVVLRPASVFAGKKFDRTQLRAADALVITLMNKGGNGNGSKWQTRMKALARGPCLNCTLFPSDGNITRQRVYDFSFTPLSITEHIALSLCYGCMALYVLISLRRLKAFHSRFGLFVTAITQMTCSILSSFTICGILKINLSMVPQNAYPFVVLVLGVENIFRLINAVLLYPPTMATELRIANALGDIGPLSVAAAAQNLIILGVLSTVVSPGVAAFCAFAAIASLFDALYLLTFFVAVLSVDIRRLELQDALAARHNRPRRMRQLPAQHTWIDALVQGRLPFSTRMAGTAVTTTFVLSLNYHFFEQKVRGSNVRDLFGLFRGGPPTVNDLDTFAPPPMNASLTPAEWMRMQDFDTAKEVMRLAKPGADTFIIRLFAPLVVVLGNSDRTGVPKGPDAWSQAVRSFTIHHFYPVAVAIVFIVAFVAVLMNFLLYNEAGDEDNDIALAEMDETLSTTTVMTSHRLDIVRMAGNDHGHFVTIGLDKTIAMSSADHLQKTHQTFKVPLNILTSISWPVRHLAIDDSGEWIACHCADDRILAFNSAKGIAIPKILHYPDDHPATIFTFVTLPTTNGSKLYFTVLTSGGRLAMSCLEDDTTFSAGLSSLPLMGATIIDRNSSRQLLIVTMEAIIASHTWSHGKWIHSNSTKLQLETENGHLTNQVGLQSYSDLDTDLIIVTVPTHAVFLNSSTLAQVARFDLSAAGFPAQSFLIGASRRCSVCGSLALRRVGVVGTRLGEGDNCSLATWAIDDDADASICLEQSDPRCRNFESAGMTKDCINAPGAWSVVQSHATLGLRKKPNAPSPGVPLQYRDNVNVRRRRRPNASQHLRDRRNQGIQAQIGDDEHWEAYKLSLDGECQNVEIDAGHEDGNEGLTALYVTTPGPVVALDGQAIAVAFGNVVKIIRSERRNSIGLGRRSRVGSLNLKSEKKGSMRKTR